MKTLLPLVATVIVTIASVAMCGMGLLAWIVHSSRIASQPPTVSPLSSPLYLTADAHWIDIPVTLTCTPEEEWLTYTNSGMGFSLRFPPDTQTHQLFSEAMWDSVTFVTRPSCYDLTCPQILYFQIRLLENPQRLSVRRYAEQVLSPPLPGEPTTISLWVWLTNGASFKRIAGKQALHLNGSGTHPRIIQLAGQQRPVTFVPHDDRILKVSISASGKNTMPPFAPPCWGGEKLVDKILGTMLLLPAQ